MDTLELTTVRLLVERSGSGFRLKALLILSNLLDVKLIGKKQLDWLLPLVDSVPETWTLNDYAIAIPLLRNAGYDVGELTCDVYKHVVAREKLAIAEWIIRNAEGLGVRLHLHITPSVHQPQLT